MLPTPQKKNQQPMKCIVSQCPGLKCIQQICLCFPSSSSSCSSTLVPFLFAQLPFLRTMLPKIVDEKKQNHRTVESSAVEKYQGWVESEATQNKRSQKNTKENKKNSVFANVSIKGPLTQGSKQKKEICCRNFVMSAAFITRSLFGTLLMAGCVSVKPNCFLLNI